MAAGDVVSGIAAGVNLTFQPAASVEVCITYFGSWIAGSALTDGVTTAALKNGLNIPTLSLIHI